jgi:hypothetical protein
MDLPNFEIMEKHEKYLPVYKPNKEYWGLGIENETYIEVDKKITKPVSFVNNKNRERYSVDYWKTYDDEKCEEFIKKYIKIEGNNTISFPLLINSHSLTKTDRNGYHKTTYAERPQPNPKYCGVSIFDELCELCDYFKVNHDIWYCFDGDTIEFITQNFYKAQVQDTINELLTYKKEWMKNFSKYMKKIKLEGSLKGKYHYPKENHGLAIYHTNRNNVAVFNNGTYHINLTLPTELDENCDIRDWNKFVMSHRKVARLFQWITPFLIVRFGSPDMFSKYQEFEDMFPKGSQRLCVSRYIGACTYDTENMPVGKILTLPYQRVEGRWYEKIYESPNCTYKKGNFLGQDINFHKHKNHGLEFRIFDWFPEEYLEECIGMLVWMCDEALNKDLLDDPRFSEIYNDVLARAIWKGGENIISNNETEYFAKLCGLEMENKDIKIEYMERDHTERDRTEANSTETKDIGMENRGIKLIEMYECIRNSWKNKWHMKGEISLKMYNVSKKRQGILDLFYAIFK